MISVYRIKGCLPDVAWPTARSAALWAFCRWVRSASAGFKPHVGTVAVVYQQDNYLPCTNAQCQSACWAVRNPFNFSKTEVHRQQCAALLYTKFELKLHRI